MLNPLDFTAGIAEITSTIQSVALSIDAIAIGVPGSVNDAGELIRSPNLPVGREALAEDTAWRHLPARYGFVRNDAEMGALGEAHCGEKTLSDFIYLTWGTGVGLAQVNRHGKRLR